MKKALIIFSLLLLAGACFADVPPPPEASSYGSQPTGKAELIVVKTGPSEITIGENINVMISITNEGLAPVNATVTEYLANVNPVDPATANYIDYNSSQGTAVLPPYYFWDVELQAGGKHDINYTIAAKTVGVLSIGPTDVYAGGMKFRSNSVTVNVLCDENGVCDTSIGETHLTCPSDCAAPPEEDMTPAPLNPIPYPTDVPTPKETVEPTPTAEATAEPTPTVWEHACNTTQDCIDQGWGNECMNGHCAYVDDAYRPCAPFIMVLAGGLFAIMLYSRKN